MFSRVLIALGVVYVLSLGALAIPFATRGIFVSPDEHATWTFAERVAKTGIARVAEERNALFGGLLHPRSAVTRGAWIVPAGFLGLPYFVGDLFFISPFLAALTGPLCALVGLVALYRSARLLGGTREFAGMTVAALAFHPAWWYYSMRSLMPNVPFVALLLCAVWSALAARKQEKQGYRLMLCLLSGALLSVALTIRPSEVLWVAGLGITALLWFRRIWKYPRELVAWMGGVAVIGGIAFLLNNAAYGSPVATGYTLDQGINRGSGEAATEMQTTSWSKQFLSLAFPFGIHEYATLQHAWQYLVLLYPWMTVVGVWGVGCGVWSMLRRNISDVTQRASSIRRAGGISLLILLLSCSYLIFLYGSWTFFDNPDSSIISLGNSHVRYWLPIFVLLAPATAHALLTLRGKALAGVQSEYAQKLAKILPYALLVLMGTFSAHLVFAGNDGVLHTRKALATFEEKRETILERTPSNAVVIVDRADKYLWPYRAVMVPLRSEKTYAIIPALAQSMPLYYFGITFPPEDLQYQIGRAHV